MRQPKSVFSLPLGGTGARELWAFQRENHFPSQTHVLNKTRQGSVGRFFEKNNTFQPLTFEAGSVGGGNGLLLCGAPTAQLSLQTVTPQQLRSHFGWKPEPAINCFKYRRPRWGCNCLAGRGKTFARLPKATSLSWLAPRGGGQRLRLTLPPDCGAAGGQTPTGVEVMRSGLGRTFSADPIWSTTRR